MEENDGQGAGGHGVVSRPVATPNRGLAASRGSQGAQGRPPNSTPTPRPKADTGPPRPPSADLSAWEDPDAPRPGADLLAYLGKADGADSGTSTPRQPGPITGDGNLTQALLIARKAAEAGASSSGGDTAASALTRGASSSFKSQSSGGSFASRGDAKSRQPGRLSRGSTSTGAEPQPPPPPEGGGSGQSLAAAAASPPPEREAAAELLQDSVQQDSVLATPRSAALPTPRTETMGTTCDGGEATESPSCFAAAAAGGAGDAAAAGGAADKLRGLLYSDDEDGDDEDYQDLMTADDDALFGGGAAGRAGAGAAAARRSGAGGAGAGGSSRSLLRPAGASSSVASGTVRLSADGDADSAVDEPTGASASSSAETTTSGAAGPEPPSPPPAAAAADILMAGSGNSTREVISPVVSQSREASLPSSPSWAAGKSDGGAAGSPFAAPRASVRLGGGGAATEALEKVLSERMSTPGGLGSRATAPPPPLTPPLDTAVAAAAGSEPPAAASPLPLGQWTLPGATAQPHPHPIQQQQHPLLLQASGTQQHPYPYLHHQQQHPDHHHHPQHLQPQYGPHRSIPTPQIGEGLRQHPPQARRLYTPGQTSRSPIRGSGYVVSPAAMRPLEGASSVSPGRGVYSAVHQHQQHHHTAGRRASSPSVPLGFSRPRSPLSAGSALLPDGGDEVAAAAGGGAAAALYGFGAAGGGGAAAATGPPGLLNGGVLRAGSWVGPAAAAGSGGGGTAGPGGGGHNLAAVSRFPPAHVQNFPGGQVYRSTPISQVPGNPSDELQGLRSLDGPGGGAAAPAAAAPGGGMGAAGGAGGGGLGPAGAGRTSGSPGRMSARGGGVRAGRAEFVWPADKANKVRARDGEASGSAAAAPAKEVKFDSANPAKSKDKCLAPPAGQESKFGMSNLAGLAESNLTSFAGAAAAEPEASPSRVSGAAATAGIAHNAHDRVAPLAIVATPLPSVPSRTRPSAPPPRFPAPCGDLPQQSRGPGPATPGGPAGSGGAVAATPYAQDRFGSFSAPARPSTSPHKSRASVGGGGGRSSVFAGAGGGGGGISATAVFGGGVLSAPSAVEAGDAPSAAPPPRGVGVPALPSYTVSVGIRQGAFKQAGGPGGGGGGGGSFGSPFSAGRQKAVAAGTAAYPLLHMPPQLSPRGADGSFPAVADGGAADAAESALQYPQQAQMQRKNSLPHLPASSSSSSTPSGNHNPQEPLPGSAGGLAMQHNNHHTHHPQPSLGPGSGAGGPGAHHPQQPHQAAGPGGLYGRGGGRFSAAYESGLPAVQAAAVRSFSFDVSRRAISRA
ncbi:hypothetical protein PLESTB_000179500 [Pleodorina starrii]|uniref:Uncharacterized protein n=1 Tax=Pleodorina starrii TaxID=330485 RepID=A0A9W6BC74_9CHLO|nr:hypothetical protein PLESTB_000179500 [Pleodorina starrii]